MLYRPGLICFAVVSFIIACTPDKQRTEQSQSQSASASAEDQTGIYVASGAGYRKPVDELKAIFESQTHIPVNCIYGNMKQVTTQAKTSGKVSVVIGDAKFLKKTGIPFKEETPLGNGKLVLAVHKALSIQNIDDLRTTTLDKIIIPDSRKAIYGRAAHEVLTRLNLLGQVKAKLITVQTVPQVTSYLASGIAQAGFINRTDFLSLDPDKFRAIDIDPSLYDPILIEAALTRQAADNAQAYIRFLAGDAAQKVFKKYGLERQ